MGKRRVYNDIVNNLQILKSAKITNVCLQCYCKQFTHFKICKNNKGVYYVIVNNLQILQFLNLKNNKGVFTVLL